MNRLLFTYLIAFVILINSNSLQAQTALVKQWDKTFGGSNYDQFSSLKQTTDGGYILGGLSFSPISGTKSQASKGRDDYWVIKLDASGNKTWDKTLGGSSNDHCSSLQQTSDGGYILGGSSSSPISGDKSQANKAQGFDDYWVVKLNANGNKLWDKTIGSSGDDNLTSLQQTSDGGYILGGYTQSGISGDKSQVSQGSYDYWVVKLDASGNKIWDKTFGGSGEDRLFSLQQTSDGGYILGGNSYSGISGDKSQANKTQGFDDYWVVKLDANGNKSWDKTLGGSSQDDLWYLQQTLDGGYILGGTTDSGISGDKSQASQGSYDYWVVKLDASGNKMWDKTFGGSLGDGLHSLHQTSDGGYILGGYSASGISGDKSQVSQNGDYWLVKLDGSGNKSWDKTIGGVDGDNLGSVQQTTDGGYILGGQSGSGIGGDKSQAAEGLEDYWVVKLGVPCAAAPIVIPGSNCGAGPVTLSATGAPAGSSYVWYNAASGGTALYTNLSGMFITPNLSTTTTYYVAATNSAGCEGPRTPVTATINPVPAVSTGLAQTICADAAPIQLTGFSPAGGTWSGPGVNTSGLFTPTASLIGNHTLSYTINQNGCTTSATQSITINPLPAQPTINQISPDTLMSSVTGSSYEWKFNGSTQPNITRKLKAATNGKYAVRVKDGNNCSSVYSQDYNFTISGIKDAIETDIELYPNPTTGITTLKLIKPQFAQVKIYNPLGKCIMSKNVDLTEQQINLDLKDHAKGMYTIQIVGENFNHIKRVILE
jgi:hypothetical protein